jgi:hypothetical protein
VSYETEELEQMALEVIKEHRIPKISYAPAYMPCSKSTFFKRDLHKSDLLKDEVYKNRVDRKLTLIGKMEDSDSASAQIAALKLLADEEEFGRLAGQKIDHTTKGEKVTGFEIVDPNADTAKAD